MLVSTNTMDYSFQECNVTRPRISVCCCVQKTYSRSAPVLTAHLHSRAMICARAMSVLGRTYLLNPWCRVLLEKLTGLQLVKKFPAFHGSRRFITALTSVRHLSLSWARPIQSIYPHPTSWRSILISIHLRLGLPSESSLRL